LDTAEAGAIGLPSRHSRLISVFWAFSKPKVMMSDTNTGESVKHLPEPDGTKEISAHFLRDGRAGQHF
jgi:hypothetical protein